MSGRWKARARRARFALRWVWTGRVVARSHSVEFVCSHSQPGDVMVLMHSYRNTVVGPEYDACYTVVGVSDEWKPIR